MVLDFAKGFRLPPRDIVLRVEVELGSNIFLGFLLGGGEEERKEEEIRLLCCQILR